MYSKSVYITIWHYVQNNNRITIAGFEVVNCQICKCSDIGHPKYSVVLLYHWHPIQCGTVIAWTSYSLPMKVSLNSGLCFASVSLLLYLYVTSYHIDGLVQEGCNSIANPLELRPSCTYPSMLKLLSCVYPRHEGLTISPRLIFTWLYWTISGAPSLPHH